MDLVERGLSNVGPRDVEDFCELREEENDESGDFAKVNVFPFKSS